MTLKLEKKLKTLNFLGFFGIAGLRFQAKIKEILFFNPPRQNLLHWYLEGSNQLSCFEKMRNWKPRERERERERERAREQFSGILDYQNSNKGTQILLFLSQYSSKLKNFDWQLGVRNQGSSFEERKIWRLSNILINFWPSPAIETLTQGTKSLLSLSNSP